MQSKKKLIALSALALTLTGGAIGAKYVTDNALDRIVGAEDAAVSYTLTMNKDTCDGFKAGNADEIVTVYTPNGNPIRWKRAVVDSKGVAGTIEANPGDALTIPYKKNSTYPILYNLDPLQSVTSFTANFNVTGGSARLFVYASATPLNEASELPSSFGSAASNVPLSWPFDSGDTKYVFFKIPGTSGTALNISSLEISYKCA